MGRWSIAWGESGRLFLQPDVVLLILEARDMVSPCILDRGLNFEERTGSRALGVI